MTYIVFVAGTMDSSFDTLAEAEARVAEIARLYTFIDTDTIHITENIF